MLRASFVLLALSCAAPLLSLAEPLRFAGDDGCPYLCPGTPQRPGYLVEALSQVLREPPHFDSLPWPRAVQMVRDGHRDGLVGAYGLDGLRVGSEPIGWVGLAFYTRHDSDVDIDPRTYNLDPQLLEAAITPRTKAIIPVSLYGQCADFDAINAIASKYGIPVIEDAAQSFGASYKGKRSCNLSTVACTSFFPSKPLGCYGDGGAIFTNDDELATAIRQIARHGQDRRYHHIRVGVNSRLDTLQAAILLPKLEIFEEEIALRQKVAAEYDLSLKQVGIGTPFIEVNNISVYAQYTVRMDNRESVQASLKAAGVPTAVHYPIPLNKQPAVADEKAKLPVGDKAATQVMSLPMHPYLDTASIKIICAALTN